ncbi:MAG: glycosyltransferase family 2 protein [Kiritimatiellia bacterium]
MNRLSVLIVSWNQAERLRLCLEAVQRFLPEAQVVVVDNGSEVPLSAPRCELIRSECNLGYAGGNNLGMEKCTGAFVLLLNNDAVLQARSTVETLVVWLDAHPACAIAQAKLQLPDGTLDSCGELLTGAGTLYHYGYMKREGEKVAHPFQIFGAKGACCLLRRSVLAAVGNILFRPEFFCYYEDIDLCHRVWLAGYEVWFVPDVPVLHDEGSTARTLPSRRVWQQYLSNMLTSSVDLWGPRAWVTVAPGFLLLFAVGCLIKRVHPHVLDCPRIHFLRRRTERDLFARVRVRVPLRYYYLNARRRLSDFHDSPRPSHT